MRWKDLRILLATAQARTLSDAAKECGVSTATVSRRLSSLENDVGTSLIVRTGDGVGLTSAGRRLADAASAMIPIWNQILQEARTLSVNRSDGFTVISATERLISEFLAPNLATAPPRLRLDLVLTDRIGSFEASNAAVALQMDRPRENHLKIQKVGSLRFTWAGQSDVVQETLEKREFAGDERLLTYSPTYEKIPEVNWIKENDLEGQVVHSSSSSRALVEAAKAGLGIALCSTVLAEREGLTKSHLPTPEARNVWMITRPTTPIRDLKLLKAWICSCFV